MNPDKPFQNIKGLLAIFSKDPMWPSSANVYIIPDDNGFTMIDVGCGSISAFEYLLDGLAFFNLDIDDLHTIVLSHAHPDHMGAIHYILEQADPRVFIHSVDVVPALNPEHLSMTFNIPFAKSHWTSEDHQNSYDDFDLLEFFKEFGCAMNAAKKVDAFHEGDTLNLGEFEFQVIHTPGHAPGHVSFVDKERRILLSGDVVGQIPAWYSPGSGGVIGYFDSLDKLKKVDVDIILPSHGTVIEDPRGAIDTIKGKLLNREEKILGLLANGPKSFIELTRGLFTMAFMQFFPGGPILESHLIKLEKDGMIMRSEGLIHLVC